MRQQSPSLRQTQVLRLEKARQTDPWELISTPTLLDRPCRSSKKENHRFWPTRRRSNRQRCRSVGGSANGTGFQH